MNAVPISDALSCETDELKGFTRGKKYPVAAVVCRSFETPEVKLQNDFLDAEWITDPTLSKAFTLHKNYMIPRIGDWVEASEGASRMFINGGPLLHRGVYQIYSIGDSIVTLKGIGKSAYVSHEMFADQFILRCKSGEFPSVHKNDVLIPYADIHEAQGDEDPVTIHFQGREYIVEDVYGDEAVIENVYSSLSRYSGSFLFDTFLLVSRGGLSDVRSSDIKDKQRIKLERRSV